MLTAAMVGLAGVMLPGVGCGREAKEAHTSAERKSAVVSYRVRGQVAQVPDPANPLTELHIMHEAIDTFEDGTGTAVGMGAMTMGFDPAPGVSLEGLGRGDLIEFEFEAWYTGPELKTPHWHLTSWTKLPADAPPIVLRPAIQNMTPEERAAHGLAPDGDAKGAG